MAPLLFFAFFLLIASANGAAPGAPGPFPPVNVSSPTPPVPMPPTTPYPPPIRLITPPPPPPVKLPSPPPAVKLPPPPPSPPLPTPPVSPPKTTADCIPLCSVRCKLHSRKNVCLRACTTCCLRCKCVPPGQYGNREKCGKCYANMTTRGGRLKCP
ncbi:gibberellin-regulated protein 14-like [Solanum tuberosum]|uniref:gibberellin-regulated protein 14-like n=1 Tax=Solanum tuberosum TaxID=4113 RepID=UPI00073A31A3|nr:PREDICTED: gibberellin-regulated protein 14-like [Solanum tuberosum]KAH0706399.1 hypothetical protein KY289_011475 [Solanum tuberosum]